jgi:hypothetical protein
VAEYVSSEQDSIDMNSNLMRLQVHSSGLKFAISASASLLASVLISACGGGSPNATLTPSSAGGQVSNNSINEATTLSTGKSSGIATTEEANAFVAAAATVPAMSEKEAYDIALKLWRNDDVAQHPKGSCSGCHGADFFDLTRAGATDTDLLRRAQVDGATPLQAKALVQAINQQRRQLKIPATNARTFRPFQPGGEVLLPNLTDAPHIIQVKRDVAFAKSLQPLLPTLMGPRISSIEMAKTAKNELLDLINGTNVVGANPKLLNLRKLQNGIVYPRWSADFHHKGDEGTFNDWVADIAHDAKPETKAQWHAVQDAYLTDGSNINFWKMYSAASNILQVPLLGNCIITGSISQLTCNSVKTFNRDKFLSALIGQHMMKLELTGSVDTFLKGGIGFSYLDTDPAFSFMNTRGNLKMLPANPWEIGDQGRVMLENVATVGSFKENLAKVGFPEFAQNSIDPLKAATQEERDLRLAWFWLGMSFDSSFDRISKSNATRVGEYMVATLVEERMVNHMMFSTLTRLVSKGFMQDANVVHLNNATKVTNLTPKYIMEYGYAWGYNRTVADNLWNEDKNTKFPQALKDESSALFGALTGNGFRMSMYLQMEAVSNGSLSAAEITNLTGWLDNSVNIYANNAIKLGAFDAMNKHFVRYHQSDLAADQALMSTLKTQLGITTSWW